MICTNTTPPSVRSAHVCRFLNLDISRILFLCSTFLIYMSTKTVNLHKGHEVSKIYTTFWPRPRIPSSFVRCLFWVWNGSSRNIPAQDLWTWGKGTGCHGIRGQRWRNGKYGFSKGKLGRRACSLVFCDTKRNRLLNPVGLLWVSGTRTREEICKRMLKDGMDAV
jgi:hypothetical protein